MSCYIIIIIIIECIIIVILFVMSNIRKIHATRTFHTQYTERIAKHAHHHRLI
jgi:hypothetical protein